MVFFLPNLTLKQFLFQNMAFRGGNTDFLFSYLLKGLTKGKISLDSFNFSYNKGTNEENPPCILQLKLI
jgi:hypothetical protein